MVCAEQESHCPKASVLKWREHGKCEVAWRHLPSRKATRFHSVCVGEVVEQGTQHLFRWVCFKTRSTVKWRCWVSKRREGL